MIISHIDGPQDHKLYWLSVGRPQNYVGLLGHLRWDTINDVIISIYFTGMSYINR